MLALTWPCLRNYHRSNWLDKFFLMTSLYSATISFLLYVSEIISPFAHTQNEVRRLAFSNEMYTNTSTSFEIGAIYIILEIFTKILKVRLIHNIF